MKISNTSERLKQIMTERNLRQVDILNASQHFCEQYGVKMNKSDISQYCSGKVEPNQDKLFVLSAALNVSISWLMGYDVPQEPTPLAAAQRDLQMYHALEEGLKSFNWNISLEQIDDETLRYTLSNDVCSITVPEEYIINIETKLKQFLLKELQEVFMKQNELMFNADQYNTFPIKSSISDPSKLMPNAAHERTTQYTAEERQDDESMLD